MVARAVVSGVLSRASTSEFAQPWWRRARMSRLRSARMHFTSTSLPNAKPASLVETFGTPLSQRGGGVPGLGGVIAMVAVR